MKYIIQHAIEGSEKCRSPCGERGLKFSTSPGCRESASSLPVRGAWIEIIVFKRA